MAQVAPFRALHYNPAKIPHPQEVVTPPYDVIRPQEREAFAALKANGTNRMIPATMIKVCQKSVSETAHKPPSIVNATDGNTPGVSKSRKKNDAVDRTVGLRESLNDCGRLQWIVTTQRRITARNEVHLDP